MKLTVINPVITGNFDSTFNAEKPENAAQQFWEALTIEGKYVTGNVPKFLFTMLDEKKKLHHFMVSETFEGHDAEYVIKKVNPKLTKKQSTELIDEAVTARQRGAKLCDQQEGGRRKRYTDDSSSSSDSDEDITDLFRSIRIKNLTAPINYVWYSPYLYRNVTQDVFTLNWAYPLTPYTQYRIAVGI
jgi:hypothetical protein